MDIFTSPSESLASLEPYRTYLLAAIALLFLIGIAGGGKIVVKDLIVGELKIGARCTSMLTGIVLGIIFFLIPPPATEKATGPEHISINGWVLNDEKLGMGDTLDNQFKVMLVKNPNNAVVKSDRSFHFSKIKKLSPGDYTVILLKDEQPIFKSHEVITKNTNGMVISKFNGGNYHLVTQESVINYLVQRYGDPETHWKERITISEQLADLRKSKTHKEELFKTMSRLLSSDTTSIEYELALFTLGQMKDERAQQGLGKLMQDKDAKIYSRIRAAWLLNDYFNQPSGKTFLLAQVKDEENSLGVRNASARYLTRIKDSKQICVIEQLTRGLNSKHEEVKILSYETLKRISREDFAEGQGRWEQWLESNRAKFESC